MTALTKTQTAEKRGAEAVMAYQFTMPWRNRFKLALRLLIAPECDKLSLRILKWKYDRKRTKT